MAERRSRYREMERYMSYALIIDLVVFIVFLITSGMGIIWLKVITAIVAILLSGLCLAFLFLTQELLRQRSLWMSISAGAIAICILFSLILNFPSPNPYKQAGADTQAGNISSQDADSGTAAGNID